MSHGEDLRAETDAAFASAIVEAPREADVSDVDRALIAYAEKLTLRPGEITSADLDALRAVGLDDRGIHDAAQVVSLFNYYNRVADGLGVALADDG